MFRLVLSIILGIFLVVIVGSIVLDTFPQLQPLWDEFKEIVLNLYESAKVEYGVLATVAIIVAVVIVFSTSKKF